MRFTSRMTWKHQGCLIDLEIPIIDCLSLKVLVWGRAISTIASNIDACPHHGQGLFFKLNYPHAQFACQVILCLIPGGNCKTLGFCVFALCCNGVQWRSQTFMVARAIRNYTRAGPYPNISAGGSFEEVLYPSKIQVQLKLYGVCIAHIHECVTSIHTLNAS